MDGLSAAAGVVGLAVPVFQSAKALRDRIKLITSEKVEVLAVLVEFEKDINLLESIYNEYKALLDQHHLDTDLRELAGIIRDLDEWLSSINLDLSRKELPSIKEVWKTGDLGEKMRVVNTKISGIRNRWQMRLQVCTLASTSAIIGGIGRQEGGQAEIMSMLHQMVSILQQGPVRQRAHALSMHSQVEPAGFNSQTTRVVTHSTPSNVTFSILSPDASLSYDRIKLRLDEYRTLLDSESDTIELLTDNGKVVLCRKQASDMEQFLDQAETLLQDITLSHNTSIIVALHRLRDLAEVLDSLELYDECRLAGNCALDLVGALGKWSLEFKQEQADTLALIAGLSAYQPSARTFFIHAVTIYEEMVVNDTSYSKKLSLLNVLGRAAYWADDYPELGAQWLGQAVQLMTKELPSTMVPAGFSSSTYHNYGICLGKLEHHNKAMEMAHIAVSIYRTLANDNPRTYTAKLAGALMHMGKSLVDLGQYGDAVATYEEALESWRAASAQDPLQWNTQLAHTLCNYGTILLTLDRVSEAAKVEKEAVSLYHSVSKTEVGYHEWLGSALHNYGYSCHLLGQNEEAVLAFKECIPIWRALFMKDYQYTQTLANSLHDMAISLHILERHEEANAAASECIRLSGDKAHKGCQYEPNLDLCFVCRRVADNVHIATAYPAITAVENLVANHPPTRHPLDGSAQNCSSLTTVDITPMAHQSQEVPPISQLEPFASAASSTSYSNVEVESRSSLPPAQEFLPESPLRSAKPRGIRRALVWFGRKPK